MNIVSPPFHFSRAEHFLVISAIFTFMGNGKERSENIFMAGVHNWSHKFWESRGHK